MASRTTGPHRARRLMTTEKYLTYRGDVKAAVASAGTLVFVTVHPDNHPTGVYRLDADTLTLTGDALPCGGAALVADGDTIWTAGTDQRVYRCAAKGGTPTPVGTPLANPVGALALIADARLAALAGTQIAILAAKDSRVLQTLELPEAGSCLAADPTGHWLVAGTVKGTVAVFEDEGKSEFQLSASERLHEG